MKLDKIDLKNFTPDKIRNFSIIAHIDHGKSTLADRLLEYTGTISDREKKEQFLDKLQVEKERGITVKAQTASMFYEYNNQLYLLNLIDTPGHVDFTYEVSRSLYACQGALLLVDASQGVEAQTASMFYTIAGQTYLLNLIDTPGHVDFTYEVSRSLYACQGALLLVDAAQGVQAQTMANFYLAFDQDLKIVPILNKIDLPNADPEKVARELDHLFDFKKEEIIAASAKTGIGIEDILTAVVERIPAPYGDLDKPLKALLFDSWFDNYKGVICLIAIKNGRISKGDKITLAHNNLTYEVLELG